MIISTTNICEKYRVIDTIFIIDQYKPKGIFGAGGFDFESDFETTKQKLAERAESIGGNAVIGCDFEVRMAVSQMGSSQVFEVYCFGTVVEILD